MAKTDVLTAAQSTALSTKGCCAQVPESFLTARFNGSWAHSLLHDSQGRIFLDFDPYCFQQIIAYLRQRAIDSEPVPYPRVQPSKQHMFNKLVQYLCLAEYMGKPQEPSQIKFSSSHPEIALQLEGYRAVSTAVQPGYRCAVIGNEVLNGTSLILECEVACQAWVFIGIVCSESELSTSLLGPISALASPHVQHARVQERFLGPVFPAASADSSVAQHWQRQYGLLHGQAFGWSSDNEQIDRGVVTWKRHLPKWQTGDRVGIEIDPDAGYMYMRHISRHSSGDPHQAKRVAGMEISRLAAGYSAQVVLMSNGDAVTLLAAPRLPQPTALEGEEWVTVTADTTSNTV